MDCAVQLFFNQTSPYARKARVAVHELGLARQIGFVEADPWAEPAELLSVTPLSKVPALLLADGGLVTESEAILQVLDGLAPSGRALAYLDFRLPHIAWRAPHPRLAHWLDDVSARPSMIATQPA
jgi:glutathione S-transferase